MLIALAVGVVLTRCSKDEIGTPSISYIRITDPVASDSLLVTAGQGQMIAIMGQNLGSVTQAWVNDQQAQLIPTFITNTTIITRIPSQIPSVVTNKLKLIFASGTSLDYDFTVKIPAPLVSAMVNEWAPEGSEAQINGDYFFEPITIKLSDGTVVTTTSVKQQKVTFTVPTGAAEGPITVTTNFGTTVSSFHFHDNRGMVLNFDNLNAAGSWRPGATASSSALSGNYLVLKGMLAANQRAEDFPSGGFESELWSIANGRPQGNFVNGDYSKLSLKFEVNIVDWYGSYLNICFSPWSQNNANNDVWGGPTTNARAIWGPWDGGASTNGGDFSKAAEIKKSGWMTVTIPIAKNFIYAPPSTPGGVVTYEKWPFDPGVTGSMAFWVVGSSKAAAAPGSPVELYIDNVRIVPN